MHTLQRAIQCRAFRLSYKQPQRTDVLSSITICMLNTACLTREFLTTALPYLLTATACFRSVGRRNEVNGYPFSLRFVADKLLQLVERPTVVQASLATAQSTVDAALIRRATDTFQVFNSNSFVFSFGFCNNLFGNGVIGNPGGSTFSAREPFQDASSAFRAFGLQTTTYALAASAKITEVFTSIGLSVVSSGQIGNTQINPYCVIKRFLLSIGNVNGSQQIEFTFNVRQIRFALLILQQLGMMLSRDVVNLLPTASCPNRDLLLVKQIAKDAGVIGRRPVLAVAALRTLIQFVAVRHLANCTNNCLCAQIERTLNTVVTILVDSKLPKGLGLKGMARDFIASSIGFLQCIQQQFRLLGSRQQTYFGGEFHYPKYTKNFSYLKFIHLECVIALRAYVFLPRLKRATRWAGVSYVYPHEAGL